MEWMAVQGKKIDKKYNPFLKLYSCGKRIIIMEMANQDVILLNIILPCMRQNLIKLCHCVQERF